jgi:tRNA threonylcarbamoyladenosine biosynthesis protein TsaB
MWLAMDTATDRASVALGAPGVLLASEAIVGARRHAAGLLPAIEICLARAGASFGDLEGLVLADGPGSFTGLRVAAAVVRGLHRVRRMPLWVAPSLLVCAAGVEGETAETVLAVSNALRGELFVAAYRFGGGRVESVLAPTVLTPAAVRSRVPVPVRPVGPAAATLGGQPSWPDAAVLLRLVGRAGGVRIVDDVARWEPEYGRPAEAQVKWEREHGRPLANPAGSGR